MPCFALVSLRVEPLQSVEPGTFVLVCGPSGTPTVLALVVEGRPVIGSEVVIPLNGERAFRAYPVRSAHQTCLPLDVQDLAIEIPADVSTVPNVHSPGTLVVVEQGAYLNFVLSIDAYNPDHHVLSLRTMALEEFLPQGTRQAIDSYQVTYRDAMSGERLPLFSKAQDPKQE